MSELTEFVNRCINNPNGAPIGYCEEVNGIFILSISNPYHTTGPVVEIRLKSTINDKEIPFDFEGVRLSNQGTRLKIEFEQPSAVIESSNFEIVFDHI